MTGITKAKRVSPTQMAALRNLAAGRSMSYGMPGGQSFAGGFSGTIVSLHRNGWIDREGRITPAGRKAAGLIDGGVDASPVDRMIDGAPSNRGQ